MKNLVVQGDISSLSVLRWQSMRGHLSAATPDKKWLPPRILAPTSARTAIYFHKYSPAWSEYHWGKFWKMYFCLFDVIICNLFVWRLPWWYNITSLYYTVCVCNAGAWILVMCLIHKQNFGPLLGDNTWSIGWWNI